MPRILEFISLTIFFLIILYLFEVRINSLLKAERTLQNSLIESNLTRTKLIKSLSASLSHELRSPLATIRSGISVMRMNLELIREIFSGKDSKKITSDNIAVSLKNIDESLEYLKLCDDVVDQGNMVIDLTLEKIHDKPLDKNRFLPTSILATVQRAINQYAFKPGEKEKVTIDIKEKDDFIYHGIKEVMLFVLFNLLKNSLYYSKVKSDFNIIIYTTKTADSNNLHFKDSGPGINPEVMGVIFDNFITSGKTSGTGLGLPFCKRVIEDFGGTIECISTLQKGTEFIIRFKNN